MPTPTPKPTTEPEQIPEAQPAWEAYLAQRRTMAIHLIPKDCFLAGYTARDGEVERLQAENARLTAENTELRDRIEEIGYDALERDEKSDL